MVRYKEYTNPTWEQLEEGVGKIVEIYFKNLKTKRHRQGRVVGKLAELKPDKGISGVYGYYLGFSTLVFLGSEPDAKKTFERTTNQKSGFDRKQIAYDCHYNGIELENLEKIRIYRRTFYDLKTSAKHLIKYSLERLRVLKPSGVSE